MVFRLFLFSCLVIYVAILSFFSALYCERNHMALDGAGGHAIIIEF